MPPTVAAVLRPIMNINGITPKALTQHIDAVGVRTGIHRFVNIGKQLNRIKNIDRYLIE